MSDYSEDWHEFQEKIRQERERTQQLINHLADDLCSCGITGDTITPESECDVEPDTSHRVDLGDTLHEALNIIRGNRQNVYGTPEDSFQRIADYWNIYLQHIQAKYPTHYEPLHAVDIANMMVLFKLAREEHAHKHDNYVDMCGYAAIADSMYPRD